MELRDDFNPFSAELYWRKIDKLYDFNLMQVVKINQTTKSNVRKWLFQLVTSDFNPLLGELFGRNNLYFHFVLFLDINYSVRLSDIDVQFLDAFKWAKIFVFLIGMTLSFVSVDPIDGKSVLLCWFFQ